jgi:hypothetical protein
MKTLKTFTWLLALTLAPAFGAQAAARLLPFQGRLTDANGVVIADGARVVQFKIYDAPVGGRALWNGEVQKLTANGGLVSTILGTKSSLSGVDFNQDLYLEITIDANADSQITLSDPPLLPRQSIFPAVFAYEAANARALDGYNWSPLFGTNNPADGTLLDSKIADSSLTAAKIANSAIIATKIADGAVLRSKIDTTGALPGHSLTYNGSQLVWGTVNSVNADTLDGFDWSSCFSGGNPSAGLLNVANMNSRGNLDVNGSTTLHGNTTLLAHMILRTVSSYWLADNAVYLRALGDFNHFLSYGNSLGTQTGFDGPHLAGVGGGVLGTSGNWSLRWFANGNVVARGSISGSSDRNLKENFATIDADQILDKVLSLPITKWNFKDDPTVSHIGPVSQDFRASFGLGVDDKTIATVDADGVALAAIQGLNKKVEQEDSELRAVLRIQQEQIEALKAELAALKAARK